MTKKSELRKGYKHTALGWIPEDWEIGTLNNYADITGGFAFDSSKFSSKGHYQIIKMSNIYANKLDLQRSQSFLDKPTEQELQSHLKAGDIIISLTGTIGKRDYGYTCLINNENNLLLNQRLAKISAKSINPTYLYYFLRTTLFLDQFFLVSKGGTGNQSNVGMSDLSNIKILFPSTNEQKNIAHLLQLCENTIALTQDQIKFKEQQKKALMQQLLTGRKRLTGFTDKWKKYSYDQLLKEVKRPIKWDENTLYELISVKRNSGGLVRRESLYGHQILTKNLRIAKKGDFLISKMQIVHGASSLVTNEFDNMKISGSYVSLITKDPNVLKIEYFSWLSKMPNFYHQALVSSYGVHIEKMTFDLTAFLSHTTRLPSAKEQIAICAILQKADCEITLLINKLESLNKQMKGLMQILLAGKKRIY